MLQRIKNLTIIGKSLNNARIEKYIYLYKREIGISREN